MSTDRVPISVTLDRHHVDVLDALVYLHDLRGRRAGLIRDVLERALDAKYDQDPIVRRCADMLADRRETTSTAATGRHLRIVR